MSLTPATRADLIVSDLGDETLVFDPRSNAVHTLSPFAASVFRRCGAQDASSIATALNVTRSDVEAAVDSLSSASLLNTGLSRRSLMRAGVVAAGTVVAVPLVTSVLAPAAASAISGGGGGGGTGGGGLPGGQTLTSGSLVPAGTKLLITLGGGRGSFPGNGGVTGNGGDAGSFSLNATVVSGGILTFAAGSTGQDNVAANGSGGTAGLPGTTGGAAGSGNAGAGGGSSVVLFNGVTVAVAAGGSGGTRNGGGGYGSSSPALYTTAIDSQNGIDGANFNTGGSGAGFLPAQRSVGHAGQGSGSAYRSTAAFIVTAETDGSSNHFAGFVTVTTV